MHAYTSDEITALPITINRTQDCGLTRPPTLILILTHTPPSPPPHPLSSSLPLQPPSYPFLLTYSPILRLPPSSPKGVVSDHYNAHVAGDEKVMWPVRGSYQVGE